MNYYSPDENHLKRRSKRFVRRMFIMRQLGTILCFFPILSVLLEMQRGLAFSALLFVNAFSGHGWRISVRFVPKTQPVPNARI